MKISSLSIHGRVRKYLSLDILGSIRKYLEDRHFLILQRISRDKTFSNSTMNIKTRYFLTLQLISRDRNILAVP